MVVELSRTTEEQLRDLALRQGRDISLLIEEAIRDYVTAATITDLDPAQVAEAQMALIGELGWVDSDWEDEAG